MKVIQKSGDIDPEQQNDNKNSTKHVFFNK